MLRRFMTWLLRQFQRAIGVLTGRRKPSHAPEPVRLDRGRVSRPENAADSNASAALNGQAISLEEQQWLQSIATLRLEGSSAVTDTTVNLVNSAIAGSDTHQRLDAAPAALPGDLSNASGNIPNDLPTTHSFQPDISKLIAAPFSQTSASLPTLEKSAFDLFPVLDSKPAIDEQLPGIHDLLPAIEQDADEFQSSEGAQQTPIEQTPIEPSSVEPLPIEPSLIEPFPIELSLIELSSPELVPELENEPEAIASERDQVVLFSFDITEAEVGRETGSQPLPPVREEAALAVAPIAADKPLALQEDLAPEEIASEETILEETFLKETVLGETVLEKKTSEETTSDETALEETISAEIVLKVVVPETVNSEAASSEDTEFSEIRGDGDAFNPWTTATPEQSRPSSDQLFIKIGTVKLLFKLKPGNFHGYIAPEDGTQDILFHQKYINADIFEQLDRGVRVVTIVKQLKGKLYATRIDFL